jgi:hypothetical protein
LWAQAAAATIADVYRIPIEMPALCALATISGAMGRSWAFEGGAKDGQTTHGNLYVLIGAPAGSGKAAPAAILTKPGFAKTVAQYWPFFAPLLWASLALPDPADTLDAAEKLERSLFGECSGGA